MCPRLTGWGHFYFAYRILFTCATFDLATVTLRLTL